MIRSLPLYLFIVIALIDLVLIYIDVTTWVHENFLFHINEWIGNSILFNIYMAFHMKKIDFVNRVALLGLFSFNAVNLLFMNVKMDYKSYEGFTIQIIILTVAFTLMVRPIINKLWQDKLRK